MDEVILQYFKNAFDDYFNNRKPDSITGDTEKDLRSRVNDELQRQHAFDRGVPKDFVKINLPSFLELLGYNLEQEKVGGYKQKWSYRLQTP